jgi:hypothetical protein
MIFVYLCSTWIIVELKTRFETWITRKKVNGVCLFHISHLINLMAYLFSQKTRDVKFKYFIVDLSVYRLRVLNRGWKRDSFQMMIYVNICSTWSMVQLKTRFEAKITWNDVNGVSLFHLPHVITLMAYLCSQWTPIVQVKYFMFHWSIYRVFVLNKSSKRDSLQIMIFVYVYWTWVKFELKTRFEAWITRNDVNSISLFHLSYLITLMAYLIFQRTTNVQIKYFMFDSSFSRIFVLNRGWKSDSLQ